MRSMLQVRVTDLETTDGHGEREDMIGCYRKVSHQKTRSFFAYFISSSSEIVRTDGQMDNVISRGRFGQKTLIQIWHLKIHFIYYWHEYNNLLIGPQWSIGYPVPFMHRPYM